MISEEDKRTVLRLARKYGARRIVLFGSACDPTMKNRDIDLAVEGVPDELFFKFYGELMFSLSQPVDLVDLTRKTRFSEILVSEGLQIYG